VEVKPASSDMSTAHMLGDVNSAKSQGQHFQPVWSFQQAQAGENTLYRLREAESVQNTFFLARN